MITIAATIPPMAPPDTPPLLVAESEVGTDELLIVLLEDATGTTKGGITGLVEDAGNEGFAEEGLAEEGLAEEGLVSGVLLAVGFFVVVVVVVGLGTGFFVVVRPTELVNRLVVLSSSGAAAAAAAGFLVVGSVSSAALLLTSSHKCGVASIESAMNAMEERMTNGKLISKYFLIRRSRVCFFIKREKRGETGNYIYWKVYMYKIGK
ncbi:hypothetical protein BDF21DRAFT_420073 [Thamnidium elegans]|nr:hypothetical protein BDF21DRAFT_420073 [Thamnidium elegans]